MGEKFKHKDTYGSLFPVDKEGNDSRPDYKGKCTTPDGQEYDIAIWKSQTKAGEPILQFRIDEPYQKDESPI